MKKTIFLLITCVAFVFNVHAQDVIMKTNGDEIEANVTEIGTDVIRYKKFSNPDGPVYLIEKEDVFFIKYENGDKEIFTQITNTASQKPVQSSTVQEQNDIQQTPSMKEDPYFSNNQNMYFALASGAGNNYGGFGIKAQARFGGIVGFGIENGIGFFPEDEDLIVSFGLKFYPYKWIFINPSLCYGIEYEYVGYLGVMSGVDMIFGKHFGFNAAFGAGSYDGDFLPSGDLGFLFKF